jgi:nicotinamidase/pyrazinamidase
MDGGKLPGALREGDVLVVVDVQVDFVSGSLAVDGAAAVIEPLNAWIAAFARRGLPVVATRDWHPADHQSFRTQGGAWPVHCVAGTPGAAFAPGLRLPAETWIISKATDRAREAYSGFEGTTLGDWLRHERAARLFVGGLATDYCVLHTVLDACERGFGVFVLADAIAAVNARPGDGDRARATMAHAGAGFVTLADIPAEATRRG